jgi:putative tricarboxylic transport membrane protein
MFDVLLEAVRLALSPLNLFTILWGTVLGIVVGALPGLGPTIAVSLMITVSFKMPADTALILLGAVYCGAIYGGSISAILINTPGTPGSAATTFDGYPMSRQGKAGVAMGLSATSSLVGGIFSIFCLILFAPIIAEFSVNFGPPELFMLAMCGLAIIAVVSKAALRRGIIAGCLGLMMSFFGQDLITGQSRFDFGILALEDGLPFIVGLVGMFAAAQAITLSERKGTISMTGEVIGGGVREGVRLTFKYPVTLLKSSIIGTIVGAVPGAGLSIANFLAYMETIRTSKNPDSFGKGNPEGVVACEASNNAVSGGSLIPTLTIGIPGNATTAAFLGGVMIHGLRPGLDLFSTNAVITYSLFVGLILANVCFFLIGLVAINWFAKITLIRNELLVPGILLLSMVGCFALSNKYADIVICLIFGVLGYFFQKYGFPVIAVVLGMILGPIGERGFHQSLLMSKGSYLIFITRPISLTLFVLTLLVLFIQLLKPYWERYRKRKYTEKLQ